MNVHTIDLTMSEKPAKIHLNLNDGTLIIEGSEKFVDSMFDKYQVLIQLGIPIRKTQVSTDLDEPVEKVKVKGVEKEEELQKPVEPEKLKRKRPALTFSPLPVDLKADADHLSLRDFYAEKKPKGQLEVTTLIVYYLNTYKKVEDVEPGHLISGYREVSERIPKDPSAAIRNAKNKRGWIEYGEKPRSARISILGQNLIEIDLPRKEE